MQFKHVTTTPSLCLVVCEGEGRGWWVASARDEILYSADEFPEHWYTVLVEPEWEMVESNGQSAKIKIITTM